MPAVTCYATQSERTNRTSHSFGFGQFDGGRRSHALCVLLSLTYTEPPLRFHKALGKAPKAG
jgi:hypothetical protein